jgi:hypothetical protein
MSKSIRVWVVALLVAGYAVPASAQNAINIFTEIRDAVPLRYFDSATTAAQPGTPNTLVIGFHGTDSVRFRASLQDGNTVGTRLAADTLSVVVTAPSGQSIASITCHVSGRGAVNSPLISAPLAVRNSRLPALTGRVPGLSRSRRIRPRRQCQFR